MTASEELQAAPDGSGPSVATPGADVESLERRVRVVVLAPVRLHREGIARILSADRRIELVVAESPDGISTAAIIAAQADVVLLEVTAARKIAIASTLTVLAPAIRIIACAVDDGALHAVRCIEPSAAAFVMGDAGSEELIAAILGAARGAFQCPPKVAPALPGRMGDLVRGAAIEPLRGLTPREADIATLIDEGLSNKEIARHLRIELSTVKNHVHNILEKLRASRRGQVRVQLRRLDPSAVGAIRI